MNMQLQTFENLLYIKTSEHIESKYLLQFDYYQIHTQMTIKNLLKQILNQYHKELLSQQHLASELIQTHHLVPIFVTDSIILTPLQSGRASLQYYINMYQVVSITSLKTHTKFHFKSNQSLIVPIPYTTCVSKWKSAHHLASLIALK
ncbi:competence protein ComK [Staphylococcus canis]|uniref:ComK family protein n=1 Tax=Staphylococcus canis TaxID=2724942 RepID=A0ABS0TAF4_9STAP|nr:competence protein ComK [Staphylococcus canis]MBI5975693.1 hypothetical protein [Staphylococcus canis]